MINEDLRQSDIPSLDIIQDFQLIENQPSMKNPKMKGIADTLYTWFLIRGIVDKSFSPFFLTPNNRIRFNSY